MSEIARVLRPLDVHVTRRMARTRTPGMAIALVDREGTVHLSTYGVTDLGTRTPVGADTLFEIGSISKTFTAVAVLQAVEAGLLDLHTPVADYLPWFEVPAAPALITVHHLLSHSAGLVYSADFSPDPRGVVWGLRHLAVGFPPGEHFYYSEPGYQTLTLVLEAVYRQPLAGILQSGILDPLGMAATAPAITHQIRPRLARGYRPLYDDRPAHPGQPLVPAPWLEMNSGDGCVASTAEDMAHFVRMLLNRGRGPDGALLSEESYRQMIAEKVPGSEYGYGICTFEVDGVAHVGHGGDMPGYEAAMWIGLEEGLGLILLSTQPYPSGLSWTAFDAFRAAYLGRPLPSLDPADPTQVQGAAAFEGVYHATAGEFSLTAEGGQLLLGWDGERIALERRGRDIFYANHPAFDRHLLRFGRAEGTGEDGPVLEAFHGPTWYTHERYDGPRKFDYPLAWRGYCGHYRAHNPWASNFRVVLRKGRLLLMGPAGDEQALVPLGEGVFRVGEEAWSPERIHFDQIAGGQALRAILSGCAYYRFFTP